jgi:hypothetical protein
MCPPLLKPRPNLQARSMFAAPKGKKLCYSAATNNVAQLKRLIEQKGFGVDEYYGGMTPLIVAAAANRYEAILYLLGRGADIDAKDGTSEGKTALIHAVAHGHLGIVECLLKNGADFTAKTKNGENALDAAERLALEPCSTHAENVEWCNNTTKCSFHCGKQEIVELLKDLLLD